MGGCFSDVRGGQQAVGGGGTQLPQGSGRVSQNEAVGFFSKSKGLNALFTQIELSLSASKLRDLDYFSKSDPMVVVYTRKRDGKLEELGRTEVIMNNLDPMWIEKVQVAYQFEIVQPLIFQVYDVDTKYHSLPTKSVTQLGIKKHGHYFRLGAIGAIYVTGTRMECPVGFSILKNPTRMLKLKDQEFLGEASCVLSEIVAKQTRSLTLNIHNRHGPGLKNLGTITVHAEETVASKNAVEIAFRCAHLDNKDNFSKSDPFLRISRIVETGGFVPICKTEVVTNNLNPVWKPLCLSMQQFGSKNNPLVVECFDFNSSGDHVLIGKIQKSVADFEKLYIEKVGENFVLPSFRHRGHDKVLKGQLFVDGFVEKQMYSFVDYISGGFELNFMVAVDFTASNGNPRSPDSLHYINPSGRLNAYQQAIKEVGEVIQFYDSDRLFPAWGFGGKTYDSSISHCFNLNGSSNGFEVEGIEGIMAAYASALCNISLSGPTLFGQVINRAAEIAAQSLSYNHNKYFVLLIITDGVLTDLQETKDALVRASDLPLSILIVGVGGADFKQMEILDADNGHRLESSTGRIATRDIVQFVPMREVHGGQTSVVQALLEELPGQFLTYMRSRDIKPTAANVPQVERLAP